jgi:hypothetical protein
MQQKQQKKKKKRKVDGGAGGGDGKVTLDISIMVTLGIAQRVLREKELNRKALVYLSISFWHRGGAGKNRAMFRNLSTLHAYSTYM